MRAGVAARMASPVAALEHPATQDGHPLRPGPPVNRRVRRAVVVGERGRSGEAVAAGAPRSPVEAVGSVGAGGYAPPAGAADRAGALQTAGARAARERGV